MLKKYSIKCSNHNDNDRDEDSLSIAHYLMHRCVGQAAWVDEGGKGRLLVDNTNLQVPLNPFCSHAKKANTFDFCRQVFPCFNFSLWCILGWRCAPITNAGGGWAGGGGRGWKDFVGSPPHPQEMHGSQEILGFGRSSRDLNGADVKGPCGILWAWHRKLSLAFFVKCSSKYFEVLGRERALNFGFQLLWKMQGEASRTVVQLVVQGC